MAESKLDPQALAFSAQETQIAANKVMATLSLLIDEECTVPFIARYRKERTGDLDETQIRAIQESYENYLEREKRRAYILEAIKKLELLTPELEKKIVAATTLNQLEDLYAPYKSKKKTKGMTAKEAGLEPLANIIEGENLTMAELVTQHGVKFLNPDKKIASPADAIKGACDIIIEKISHNTELKESLRKEYWKSATLKSSKRDKAEEVKDFDKYKDYFEFNQGINELTSAKTAHRFLAMRRGMTQKVLKLDIDFDSETAMGFVESMTYGKEGGVRELLEQCGKKAYANYIHSSLDLEVKTELKKVADEHAINVFGVNLKNLLLQPYLGSKTVVGVDPGVRTGCKVVVIDNTGKLLVDTVIYPHPPKNSVVESGQILSAIIEQFKAEYIAIGNGTYSRETLHFVEAYVPEVKDGKCKATVISEAGASIYSASEIAKKEFPDKDVTVRGAVSIARRFQDPLAELVKIDAKSIGVGQYQHDVNQSRLKKSLEGVVEGCVNFVGVDLNTASAPLLSYISGIGPGLSANIVKKREELGGFKTRQDLLAVSRFSEKVFTQAAGFLRIYNGENPLDATFIHPETYNVIEDWAKGKGLDLKALTQDKEAMLDFSKDKGLSEKLGEFTHQDVYKALSAPSQDPRTEFKSFEFRKDIKTIGDLKVDEWYPGVVTNITQFGAFVDIGIKENGLVHVSQIADKFVENALEVLKVGEEVKVRVMDVDLERKRVALSCKTGEKAQGEYRDPGYNQSRGGKKKGGGKPRQNNNAPLKNNAFAALKGLKL